MGPNETDTLLYSKGHYHWNKVAAYRMGRFFKNYIFNRELLCKTYKELKKLDTNKTINPIINGGTDLNTVFSKEEIQMAEQTLNVQHS